MDLGKYTFFKDSTVYDNEFKEFVPATNGFVNLTENGSIKKYSLAELKKIYHQKIQRSDSDIHSSIEFFKKVLTKFKIDHDGNMYSKNSTFTIPYIGRTVSISSHHFGSNKNTVLTIDVHALLYYSDIGSFGENDIICCFGSSIKLIDRLYLIDLREIKFIPLKLNRNYEISEEGIVKNSNTIISMNNDGDIIIAEKLYKLIDIVYINVIDMVRCIHYTLVVIF